MALQVTIVSATNVPNLETFGKSDPYVDIEFQGQKKKTTVKDGDLNPTWNESFEYDLKGAALKPEDEIKFTIKDYEKIGRNKLLGSGSVAFRDFLRSGNMNQEMSPPLMDSNSRPLPSKLSVRIAYKPPPGAEKAAAAAAGGGGTEVGGDIDEGDAEDEGEDEPEGPPEIDPATGQPKPRKKKRKRMGRRKIRGKLSHKEQDFQIRIKVVEARQLQGNNIQPVSRISASNQMKQTRIKKSTNSPYFNESFFFNFHESPSNLFDEVVEFQVFNSKKLRSDALIGSFKCDIGFIYDEPKHSLVNKWLLLSDPEDNMAGAKGYLKICAAVLGPGDEAPNFKTETQDDSQDIESNLLRPAGVQLRPATFHLKVYRAEDIPRMDSAFLQGVKSFFGVGEEKKELVDPYFVASFAGKDLESKIMYSNDHPEWNQCLKIGLQFPSMCERIKMVIKDWDRITEDDTIGTHFIPISSISSIGDSGFLPTFGPTYVNFYGATREYSDLPCEYDDLNMGKGEGVAYRGRALVELTTELGKLPESTMDDIGQDDILRVQKFMRRRKFRLHSAFLNAGMITAIDAPVEFEVSMGNYGNKLDENILPSSSTSQPTNAVFDGCHYYYLPWGKMKPCVAVDCHWEDIAFRLEGLNILIKAINTLETNIERCKTGMKAKLPMAELAQLLIILIDKLIEDCRKPLPEPQPGHHNANELDKLLRQYRQCELEVIVEMATTLRENATDIGEALSAIDNYLQMLKNLALEPQNSMPDIIIWMISGEKRIAYHRIPANDLLFSSNPNNIGQHCGKIQTIQLKYPGSTGTKNPEVPGLLRAKFWLGLQDQEPEWHKMQSEGELAVFAETYENQCAILGNWVTRGPQMTRPKWSDSQGNCKIPKDKFVPPSGWRWEGDWYISPEMSMLYEKDAGHRNFLEDVYECQYRLPAGSWQPASRAWTDVKGDETTAKDAVQLDIGWKWDDDWQADLSRAVDEEGFEYCVEATIGGYGPVEKTYHMCRRRRWVRPRTLVVDQKKQKVNEKKAIQAAEGWEYAPLFNTKFHAKNRTMDFVRRRRWHRKMLAEDPNAPCFFNLQTEDSDDDEQGSSLTAPRMFLQFKNTYKYQMRSYVYQARDLLAADDTGLSDPFARVCFLEQSLVTEKIKKSLCPTWDQSLIFEEVEIFGDPKFIEKQPPEIYIELFDYDTFGKPEFLGRTKAKPMVKLNPGETRTPMLQWYDIKRNGQYGGELLAAFELFLYNGKDMPFLPPKRGALFTVPSGIRPVLQRTGIEVLCWGVRNMSKFQLSSVNSPNVELECGGHLQESQVIKNTARNPNFDDPVLFFDVMLPKEELYMPPINIKVRDHRQFGRKPTVGNHCLRNIEAFRCAALPPATAEDEEDVIEGAIVGNGPGGDHVIEMPVDEAAKEDTTKLEEIDWWSKYYASIGDFKKCKKYIEKGYDKIKVYPTPLEQSDDFGEFRDFCSTFDLRRGKESDDEDEDSVGQFKGTFRVYPLPPDPNEPMPRRGLTMLPATAPEECLVRIYVIRCTGLQPNDPNGLADPFVEIKLGKKKMNNRDDYIPNSLDPVFGKMFEMNTVMPIHKDLTVKVMDYDLVSSDDVIGETMIDLENRFLTKYSARCGLPKTYCTSGPNQWRDSKKPKEILEIYCKKNGISGPMFYGNNSVKVANKVHNLVDFEMEKPQNTFIGGAEQRLALYLLHTFPIVKEHVETRPLFNPLQPGIEQGRIQMWVDIFPKALGPPGPPFNIIPRKPSGYQLRVIVWNTVDVILEEESITGEQMSDIYVKGWLAGYEESQKTDVHYRSLDGEGNFNWRFIFPFDYMPAEQVMVVKEKEHFWSLDSTEQRVSPNITMQVWDNDKFSGDDFLGTLEMNMHAMMTPSKNSRGCTLDLLPDFAPGSGKCKLISLFDQKRVRGFFPVFSDEGGERKLTGKIEMELELLTHDESEIAPAGKARDEPNTNPTLEEPKRPATSFLWFTSPWKTLKFIIWRRYKWYFIGFVIILLLLILVALLIYSFPGAFNNWLLGN